MEQDPHIDSGLQQSDQLPTYDELAAQQGPNSRFGRWKSWVEKRAAERYAEDTPEKRLARRMRGWGPHVDTEPPTPPPISPQDFLTPPTVNLRRTQTVLSGHVTPPEPEGEVHAQMQLPSSQITVGQALTPSHLRLHTFGSRFLPHSEGPILSLLPLCDDTKLLIGHTNGLSMLDMDPELPLSELTAKEPHRREIWRGEGIYQLELLEHEQASLSKTPKGVVLALVGAESPEGAFDKDYKEPHRAIRMYNLASLASIAQWAATRKDHEPLELCLTADCQLQQQAISKKQKYQGSSRGLKLTKSNVDNSPRNIFSHSGPSLTIPPQVPPKDLSRLSSAVSPAVSPAISPTSSTPYKNSPRPDDSAGSEWEIVGRDNLPLRWATDYVPLATPGSRLANQSVLFFELQRCTDPGRVTARLAVATKQNILLYESLRGERAFRFVKEFYTPIPARSATFIYQGQPLTSSLSPTVPFSTTHSPTSYGSSGTSLSSRRASSPISSHTTWSRASSNSGYLSLFVIFEKKAGLIRISDSAVGEIDLWEESGHARRASGHSPISGRSFRLSITSFETPSVTKDWLGPWAPPAEVTLPLTPVIPRSSSSTNTITVNLLTRGKHTHILPSPLPIPLSSHPPLKVLKWGIHPNRIVPRLCERPVNAAPFLQVTALSEDGVEVQEFALTFLFSPAGKGKARDDDPVIVQADVGPGGAGFLRMGGHWTERDSQRPGPVTLQRSVSTSTVDTVDLRAKRSREQGFYAWTQKGYNDWRVFWLGGDVNDGAPPPSP